jgi:threonine dehydrogenase-like Zn-dependent dehydrogenase
MKAWRFYGFNNLRMDDISPPACRHGHVVVKVRCVQPSVTEAQLARGIKTFAYDRIKKRLETEAPVRLFGHEFCAEIVEVGGGVSKERSGGHAFSFFALMMVLQLVMVSHFLLETKGVSLEQIQRKLGIE